MINVPSVLEPLKFCILQFYVKRSPPPFKKNARRNGTELLLLTVYPFTLITHDIEKQLLESMDTALYLFPMRHADKIWQSPTQLKI